MNSTRRHFHPSSGPHRRGEELLRPCVERADRLHRDVPAPVPEDQDPAEGERRGGRHSDWDALCRSGADITRRRQR